MRAYLVEALRELEQCLVPSRPHFAQDGAHRGLHACAFARVVVRELGELGIEARGSGGEPPQFHRTAALAKPSISGWRTLRLVLSAAWLTISRADTAMISSTGMRSFAL